MIDNTLIYYFNKPVVNIITSFHAKVNLMSPQVFFSYSHDNEEHKNWVLQLATRLRSNGVDVILDRWNLSLGSNIAHFMEQSLSTSHRIVCVISDNYLEKANSGNAGVGYEKIIMTSEILNDQNNKWIIPILKNGARLV